VDPNLVKFAADLDWLKSQGVVVERFNLSQQPMAFAEDADVKASLQAKGEGALPLIKVDDQVKSRGTYPSRDRLAEWVGVPVPPPSLFTEAVQELVAMGAAIASNCEPCFKFHYDKARKLGVSREDMQQAVRTAQSVKEAPAKSVLHLAERYLTEQPSKVFETSEIKLLSPAPSTGCCGGSGETNGACC
jgi:AhpD family alkylhydroperoxidase